MENHNSTTSPLLPLANLLMGKQSSWWRRKEQYSQCSDKILLAEKWRAGMLQTAKSETILCSPPMSPRIQAWPFLEREHWSLLQLPPKADLLRVQDVPEKSFTPKACTSTTRSHVELEACEYPRWCYLLSTGKAQPQLLCWWIQNFKGGKKAPNSCPQHIPKQGEKPAKTEDNMKWKPFLTVTARPWTDYITSLYFVLPFSSSLSTQPYPPLQNSDNSTYITMIVWRLIALW